MARRKLRIYRSEAPQDRPFGPEATVPMSLRDLLPLVAMAQKLHLVWLQDFLDDEVKVTTDLFEVLQAYKACRPSA